MISLVLFMSDLPALSVACLCIPCFKCYRPVIIVGTTIKPLNKGHVGANIYSTAVKSPLRDLHCGKGIGFGE